ncbi:response regulator, partial [Streptomyces sp. MCAF7]
VDAASDGATALRLAATRHPDVVVLDLGLPDMDGVEVIKGLRGWTRVPILVLSARQTSDEKVEALDAGADDYVTKPFGMDELLARLRAAVRRAEPVGSADGGAVVETEGFTVDLAAKKVNRGGVDVRLTPTEWHLLEVLVRNTGRLVSQKQLLQEVWGPSYGTETNYLRVY